MNSGQLQVTIAYDSIRTRILSLLLVVIRIIRRLERIGLCRSLLDDRKLIVGVQTLEVSCRSGQSPVIHLRGTDEPLSTMIRELT